MNETIHEMSRKMMGITAVVSGKGDLAGVISDGDLRRSWKRTAGFSPERRATACIPRPGRSARTSSPPSPWPRMEEAKITSFFILDEQGRLSGALHLHDILSSGIR
jgi:arabinose-5-phosphate isomerase